MKTIQMTIDEDLLSAVDEAIQAIQTTRSAFIREALIEALRRRRIADLEQRHANGYACRPVVPGEFDIWQDEQSWEQT